MAKSQVDDYSDLTELGIDVAEGDELTVKFDKCVKHVQCIAGTLDNETLLKCYSLYKQSLEGPCNTPKPSWYDMRGKAKWEAWNSLGNMDKNDAKNKYIELVLEISPDFTFDEAGSKSDSWVRVSSLAQEPTLDKNICDFIRNGDIKKVTEYIQANGSEKNLLDGSGMGLLHYAADIGNVKILEMLLSHGVDINLQDSEGQTALHYAASCGHPDIIKLLKSKGAKLNILDGEGCAPIDVTSDERV